MFVIHQNLIDEMVEITEGNDLNKDFVKEEFLSMEGEDVIIYISDNLGDYKIICSKSESDYLIKDIKDWLLNDNVFHLENILEMISDIKDSFNEYDEYE